MHCNTRLGFPWFPSSQLLKSGALKSSGRQPLSVMRASCCSMDGRGRPPGLRPPPGRLPPRRPPEKPAQSWADLSTTELRLNRINLPWENFQSIQLATFSRTELMQLMPAWLSLASSPWRDDFERDSTIYWTDIFERAASIDRQAVSENDVSVSKTEILTKGHLNSREGLQKSRFDSIQLMIQRKTCDYDSTQFDYWFNSELNACSKLFSRYLLWMTFSRLNLFERRLPLL